VIARHPLFRSGRGALPYPAPTLGENAQAHERIRMADTRRRRPPGDEARHSAPRQMIALAATAQHLLPQISPLFADGAHRRAIHGHAVIPEVTRLDRAQISPLFRDGPVQALPFDFQRPQLGLPTLSHRLPQHREPSLRPPVKASTPPSRAAPYDSGRCGSRDLQRMKLSFTTPCRF
jgi:hypothetical protein